MGAKGVVAMKVLNYSDEKLETILSKLIPEFHPKKIFLFGSHVRGFATDDSDYDLLLIINSSAERKRDRSIRARKSLTGIGIPVDVFIYTESEFDDWKNEFSSIPHTVEAEGLEIKVG